MIIRFGHKWKVHTVQVTGGLHNLSHITHKHRGKYWHTTYANNWIRCEFTFKCGGCGKPFPKDLESFYILIPKKVPYENSN